MCTRPLIFDSSAGAHPVRSVTSSGYFGPASLAQEFGHVDVELPAAMSHMAKWHLGVVARGYDGAETPSPRA